MPMFDHLLFGRDYCSRMFAVVDPCDADNLYWFECSPSVDLSIVYSSSLGVEHYRFA